MKIILENYFSSGPKFNWCAKSKRRPNSEPPTTAVPIPSPTAVQVQAQWSEGVSKQISKWKRSQTFFNDAMKCLNWRIPWQTRPLVFPQGVFNSQTWLGQNWEGPRKNLYWGKTDCFQLENICSNLARVLFSWGTGILIPQMKMFLDNLKIYQNENLPQIFSYGHSSDVFCSAFPNGHSVQKFSNVGLRHFWAHVNNLPFSRGKAPKPPCNPYSNFHFKIQ